MSEKIEYINIAMVEGTTRFVEVTCKDQSGDPFDLSGYEIRTWISFDNSYLPTVVVENIVSYEIPASLSVGKRSGIAETRIFKDGRVFEVIRVKIAVVDAKKPDIEPVEVQA